MIPRFIIYLQWALVAAAISVLLAMPSPHSPLSASSARLFQTLSQTTAGTLSAVTNTLADLSSASKRTRVLFDMDGNVDDFISLLILLSRPDIEVAAVTVLAADCEGEPALSATRKILHLTGHAHIPVALSTLGAINPFPRDWRTEAFKIDVLPILNQDPSATTPNTNMTGEELLRSMLFDSNSPPAAIVCTGPLTNVAWALRGQPASLISERVKQLYWMGGALRVPGNVYFARNDADHDFVKEPLTEWNAYWDPVAVADVFGAGVSDSQPEPFPLTIFPLDITNSVPISRELLLSFGQQYHYRFSAAAGAAWSLVGGHTFRWGEPYYAWDSLTVACFANAELCQYAKEPVEAVSRGWQEGRTLAGKAIRKEDHVRTVRVASSTSQKDFESFVLSTLRR